ncbi:Trehalose 2-sulfotransferase [Alphaproteobacteria bacterium SO-S41]|nr:Trehalose 2-sulfotransferase [Alphaproteobacteria bacterium SO-S41]
MNGHHKSYPVHRGYAICTAPRSGSNFLCQILASTGQLGRPLEYFNEGGRRHFDDPDYPSDRQAQIEKILTMGATPNGIYALKIFAYQHDAIEGHIRWADALPGLRFVVLQRRDLLGQAISWSRSLQTGQYRHGQASTGTAHYDAGQIAECLKRVATEYARWDVFFARNGAQPLRLYYEDLTANVASAVADIAALVGVPPPAADPDFVTVRIQRDEESDAWRRRFIAERGDLNIVEKL